MTTERFDRRRALAALASLGVGTAAFQRSLAAQADQAGQVTPEMIEQAEWIAGISLSEDERKAVAAAVARDQRSFETLRKVELTNSVPPALAFFAAPPQEGNRDFRRGEIHPLEWAPAQRPKSDDDLAFLPVTELSALVRAKTISSLELTKLYFARLQKYNDLLKCVVSFTEDLALKQAHRADREIAAGLYRGPLHGIPWGAK